MGKFLDFSKPAGFRLLQERSKVVEIMFGECGPTATEVYHSGGSETNGGCTNNLTYKMKNYDY